MPGSAWVVPVKQTGYAVIKTLFERVDTFQDTVFTIFLHGLPPGYELAACGSQRYKRVVGRSDSSEEFEQECLQTFLCPITLI